MHGGSTNTKCVVTSPSLSLTGPQQLRCHGGRPTYQSNYWLAGTL